MDSFLASVFPVWDVEGGCIVSRNGDYTVCFAVTKPEIFTSTVSELSAVQQGFCNALRLLLPGTIVHLQDWFTRSTYHANADRGASSFLSGASERFFHERPYLDHRSYLYVTRPAGGRRKVTSATSALFRKRLVPSETLDRREVQRFLDTVGQFAQLMGDIPFFSLRRLAEEEIWSYGGKIGVFEQYCQLLSPEDLAVLADVSFEDGIWIGDQYCQLFTLADLEHLPGSCGPNRQHTGYSTEKSLVPMGFATAVGPMLDCDHLYNQYLIVQDPREVYKRLEGRRGRLHSLSNYSQENAVARDAIDRFIQEGLAEGRLPVKAHFNVQAWSGRGEISLVRNTVSSAIAKLGASPHIETVGAAPIWYAGIPGNAAELPMNELFDIYAEQAACFCNWETNYRSSVSPVGLRLGDRLTGRPLHVDISDEPMKKGITTNRNKLIMGGSGGGKSFFCNAMVRAYYEQGAHVVLVDIGHSYRGLCELVGGYYFSYSEQEPIRFNPFFLGKGVTLDTEKRESILALLLALWKRSGEELMRSEYVALSKVLQLYYDRLDNNPDIFPCFDSFYEFLGDDFAAVLVRDKVKEKEFDLTNFLYILRPFYRGGEYDYLLNARDNLDLLDQRLCVFELDAIRDHGVLLPVATIMIMSVFISKMRRLSGVRKVILIEEAWKAIAREGMAEYMRYLFKTVRKFYGEAIVVTQEVEDIISSTIVKNTIINLSDCKILLDMGKFMNRFDEIQAFLGLSEKDKALVLSLNKANDPDRKYKEVFIGLGTTHSKVYRMETSLEEYLAYTTEESEKLMVMEYAKRYGNLQRGIAALAAEWRERGSL